MAPTQHNRLEKTRKGSRCIDTDGRHHSYFTYLLRSDFQLTYPQDQQKDLAMLTP